MSGNKEQLSNDKQTGTVYTHGPGRITVLIMVSISIGYSVLAGIGIAFSAAFLNSLLMQGLTGVFLPQSPYHPSCGSAIGGSQRKSSRSRVMNVHLQVFIWIERFNDALHIHSSNRIHSVSSLRLLSCSMFGI